MGWNFLETSNQVLGSWGDFRDMKHVLVAEDEKYSRLAVSLVLKKTGYRVSAVENGHEALTAIEANQGSADRIDVVLTDVQMPVMSGLELINELKRRNIRIPVIILTGNQDEDEIGEMVAGGCCHFIQKPFDPKQLADILAAVLAAPERCA